MKEKKAFYPVFTNKNNKKLVFYPVKKNANSSAKLFFAKQLGIESNFYFLEDQKPRYLITKSDYNAFKEKQNLMQFFVNNFKFAKVDIEFKACIIRDPLERFTSAYKNRILFHKDKEFYEHNVNQIIEKLESNIFENKHFIPQSYFLGDDLSYYNTVGLVSKINMFADKINIFFENKVPFPRIQTGGKNFKVDLSNKQIEKIKQIYLNDYNLVKQWKI